MLRRNTSDVPEANGKYAKDGHLDGTGHTQPQEYPKRHGQDSHVRSNINRRLDNVEAVVDADRVRVGPQLPLPIGLNRHALEESAEKHRNGMHNDNSHNGPDDLEDGIVVAADAQQEYEDGALHECKDRVVAHLLEEIEP